MIWFREKRKWRNKFKKNLPKYVKKQKIIMQPFNLTRLNMFSPYPVWQNSNESYAFRTDFGIIFRVVFTRNQNIWQNEEAYEFGLFNENRLVSPNDPKVKATIQCIIEEFFLTNPNILLYQCETGDNRQAIPIAINCIQIESRIATPVEDIRKSSPQWYGCERSSICPIEESTLLSISNAMSLSYCIDSLIFYS